jgi:hypothetical protein
LGKVLGRQFFVVLQYAHRERRSNVEDLSRNDRFGGVAGWRF